MAALATLCAAVVIGLGRLWVWSTQHEDAHNLRGAPQSYTWHEDFPDFGGYSALIIDPDGLGFIAGSDRRHYVTGQLARDGSGHITGIAEHTRWPVVMRAGAEVSRFQGDLEGLTRLSDGRIGMAFENFARLQIMEAPGVLPVWLHPWDKFYEFFGNRVFEAIATLPGDALLGLFQHSDTAGQTLAYLYQDDTLSGPYPFAVTKGFDVSGADLGPDGCLYILERRYAVFSGFTFRLVRTTPAQPWDGPREVLYRSKPMQRGNGEAVSVWQSSQGLKATIITDDGFPPLAETRIIELPVADHPAPGCVDQ